MFTNLRYLNFSPSSIGHQRLSFNISPLTVISTNLLELHVCLDSFSDCLYLLDGRFNRLDKLYVNISCINSSGFIVNNKVDYFDYLNQLIILLFLGKNILFKMLFTLL